MQKVCGIIAIGAIVLSASHFASAQTAPSDQSPQAAGKPALRDQVKDALQQAGFKNIRIISESFLVRALDQNGDPVVMMIRPESLKTVRAPSEEDDGAKRTPKNPAIRINGETPKTTGKRPRRRRAKAVSANR